MVIVAMTKLAIIPTNMKRYQSISIPGEVANLSMIHASHTVRAASDCSSRLYRRLSLGLHIDGVENHCSSGVKGSRKKKR